MWRSSDTCAGPTSRVTETDEMQSAFGSRLLSIGEIFDRAVHVTIANLLPFIAIVGLVEVPARAIIDWTSRVGLTRSFGVEGKMVADPRLLASYFTLMHDPHATAVNWSGLLWYLGSLIPFSLAIAAASIASHEFLSGETPKMVSAYRSAIRRLAPVIGASVLSWGTYTLGIAAVAVVVVVSLVVWFLLFQRGGGALAGASLDGFAAGSVFTALAAIAWLTPLANCTFVGAALYVIRPFKSLREAWKMTMSRGLRGRSLAFGAAFLALMLAQEFFRLIVCGFLSDVTHVPWISFVASDAITLLALIFGMALAVVYYLDARNRVALIQDPLAEQENSRSQ
jgi:preprotein translocase subunit SecG